MKGCVDITCVRQINSFIYCSISLDFPYVSRAPPALRAQVVPQGLLRPLDRLVDQVVHADQGAGGNQDLENKSISRSEMHI